MYKFIKIIFFASMMYIFVPVLKSEAQIVCTPTYFFGNKTCTNSSTGSSITQKKQDFFGNDIFQNNKTGQQTRCKKDFFGNYVCN